MISKKKKKRSSSKFRVLFRPKFKGIFLPSLDDLQKKKKRKRSSPKLRLIFRPILQIQTFEGGLFSNGGGLFSIFHIKSASKAQKTCDFAYFTSQWGGLEPPRPPLATLLIVAYFRESSRRRALVPNLPLLSETRWTSKYKSIRKFKENFSAIS